MSRILILKDCFVAWFKNSLKDDRNFMFACLVPIVFLVIVAVFDLFITEQVPTTFAIQRNSTTPHVTSLANNPEMYTVKQGEFLIALAQKLGVSWEAVWVLNRDALSENTKKHCAKYSEKYTHRAGRKGHFCNFMIYNGASEPLVYANTLKAGDQLLIPPKTAFIDIQGAVDTVVSKNIVINDDHR